MKEILHQLVDSLSHYLQGSIHPRWLFGISEPSTVSLAFTQFVRVKLTKVYQFLSMPRIQLPQLLPELPRQSRSLCCPRGTSTWKKIYLEE